MPLIIISSMHEIDVFLNGLKTKNDSVKKLYTAGLNAWKKSTKGELRAENATEKDVDRFIFDLEKEQGKRLNTIIDYLTPLAALFGKYKPALRLYVLKKQREYKTYMKTVHKDDQIPIFDLAIKMINAATTLQHKLCLWLVTAEGMANISIANLQVGHINFKQHTYTIPLSSGTKHGELHPYTMKLIKRRIDDGELNTNDRLVGVCPRSVQNLAKKYAKKSNFKQWRDISPNKLRCIGKNNLSRDLFIREYQKTAPS